MRAAGDAGALHRAWHHAHAYPCRTRPRHRHDRLEAVEQLARDYAWAIDVELCVFPQEGITNYPGTEELLIEGLRRGARAIGAVPYFDTDPRGPDRSHLCDRA